MRWVAVHGHKFKILFIAVIVLLVVGTAFYHQVEGFSWVDSFYFTSVTLTTVGFGDFVPSTIAGKIFTVAYLFVGIGIILGFINLLAKQRIRRRLYQSAEKEKEIDKLEEKVKKLKGSPKKRKKRR